MSIKNKPKIKIKRVAIMLMALCFMFFLFWLYWQYKLIKQSQQTFYKAFDTSIPNNFKIHGIDVSKHQSYIYWNAVKKMKIEGISINFAFIKATEGAYTTDAMFKRNWELSKQNSIPHGAYMYFIATKDGKLQAQNFIKNVQLSRGDLPPVVDIEKKFKVDEIKLQSRLKDCLTTLHKHYGVKPILYSYSDFYSNYLGENFNNYPLWIAHYTEESKPDIDRNWLFWQHSESARVNGIIEKVDFNVFNGSDSDFMNLLIK